LKRHLPEGTTKPAGGIFRLYLESSE